MDTNEWTNPKIFPRKINSQHDSDLIGKYLSAYDRTHKNEIKYNMNWMQDMAFD